MVRGSSGIAGVSRSLPTDHSLTWTGLTGDGILELFQVHSGTLVCFICALRERSGHFTFHSASTHSSDVSGLQQGFGLCVSVCGGPTLSYLSISEQYCV